MSKFSKDNKIARARRESAICSLWKIYKNLVTPNCKRNHHLTCYYKISREMCAPWLVRKSSLYFHKARAFGLTSALLRYSARSLCRRYERTQFTIHFTKGIKKTCSSSIVELYKHLGIFKNTREVREALAFGSCSSVPIWLNNALGAFFIPFIIYMIKKRKKVKTDEILKACTCYL